MDHARETMQRYRDGDLGVRRHNVVAASLMPAMRSLREAEDFARLELDDDLLAARIREVHESLSEDVLDGKTYAHGARYRARLWDRYCSLRGHDPHASASWRSRRLRFRPRRRA